MAVQKVKWVCFLSCLFVLSLLASGCFFGTFQTAETVGAGNVSSTAYVMIPTYAYSDTTMEDFAENMSAGGFFQIGATDRFDVGLFFGTAGIGAQGKLRLTPGSTAKEKRTVRKTRTRSSRRKRRKTTVNPFHAAAIVSATYNIWKGGLVPKGDLVASIRFGEYVALYGGGQIFYAPKLYDTDVSAKYVNRQIFAGFNVERGEDISKQLEWIPTALYIEFGYPLDLEKKTAMFGIGIGGANLPILLGTCLSGMIE
jgi:hypothetical protein